MANPDPSPLPQGPTRQTHATLGPQIHAEYERRHGVYYIEGNKTTSCRPQVEYQDPRRGLNPVLEEDASNRRCTPNLRVTCSLPKSWLSGRKCISLQGRNWTPFKGPGRPLSLVKRWKKLEIKNFNAMQKSPTL